MLPTTIDDAGRRAVRNALAIRVGLPGERLSHLSVEELARAWAEATAGRAGTTLATLPKARLVNVSTQSAGHADLNVVFEGVAAKNIAVVQTGGDWYFERAFGLVDLLAAVV